MTEASQQPRDGRRPFPVLRLGISLAVALAAWWLVLRGTSATGMLDAVLGVRLPWLAVALVCMVTLLALRLARWTLLVRAIQPVPLGLTVRIGAIGLMAIDLLPVRLGELVRPALLDRRAGVHFGAGVASVLVERLLDVGALLLVLVVALATARLPAVEVTVAGWTVDLETGRSALLVALVVLSAPLIVAIAAGDRLTRWLEPIVRPLPEAAGGLLVRLASNFARAGRSVGRPSTLAATSALSLLSWTASVGVTWGLLQAFDLGFGPAEAAVIMLFVAVALLLPAPAGGLGVFEAGATVGLSLYAVEASAAASFAMALHATHVGVISAVGLVALWREGLGWRDLWVARAQPAD
jgi:glycosyltransferase 2 family protein